MKPKVLLLTLVLLLSGFLPGWAVSFDSTKGYVLRHVASGLYLNADASNLYLQATPTVFTITGDDSNGFVLQEYGGSSYAGATGAWDSSNSAATAWTIAEVTGGYTLYQNVITNAGYLGPNSAATYSAGTILYANQSSGDYVWAITQVATDVNGDPLSASKNYYISLPLRSGTTVLSATTSDDKIHVAQRRGAPSETWMVTPSLGGAALTIKSVNTGEYVAYTTSYANANNLDMLSTTESASAEVWLVGSYSSGDNTYFSLQTTSGGPAYFSQYGGQVTMGYYSSTTWDNNPDAGTWFQFTPVPDADPISSMPATPDLTSLPITGTVYTVTCPTDGTAAGGLYYNSSNSGYLTNTAKSGVNVAYSETDVNQQFAFLNGALGTYLYSVGGGRFVNGQTNNSNSFALTTALPTPGSADVTFLASTNATYNTSYPAVLQVGKQLHLKPSEGQGVVAWNNPAGANNSLRILPVDDATDLTAAYSAMITGESVYINSILATAGTLGYPKLTSTSYTNLVALRDAIQNGTFSTDTESNWALVTAYQSETDVVLPEDGALYTITGYVSAGITINETSVTDFPIYNEAGTFTVSSAASATTKNNLWLAVKDGDTYYFRSAYDGKYLSATAGLSTPAYPYTISGGTACPNFALYNSTLGGSGRYVGVGYTNNAYQFGTTGSNNYYGASKTQSSWSTDFQLAANTDYFVYTVTFTGTPSGETPTVAYGGWTGVTDGGIFVGASVAQGDLTIPDFAGYTKTVTIDNTNHTVTVAYTADDFTLTFTDGSAAVSVSVDGTTAASTYTQTTGTAHTALSVNGSLYAAFTLGGTTYYGGNNPALLAAIAGLSAATTITVTTPATSAITVTDVNGDALSTSRKYFFYNVGSQKYAWAADNKSVISPYAASDAWADNYRYTVEGAGSMLVLKSVSADTYLTASDISGGAGKISPTAATAASALVVNAGAGSTTNGFSLTPAGNFYLNFFAGGNLGFWNTEESTAATNTWKFIPALRIDFVDGNGAAVNMRATVGGVSLTYDRTNLCVPQGAAWTALAPSAAPGLPYVVKYTIGGTTYDDRNTTALYAALAALTEDATVTVTYGEAITTTDINGHALVEGNNYYVKLPGRGDYYLTQQDASVRPYEYNAAYGQTHQVKASGEYLALQMPYNGDGYYLGVTWSATCLANGKNKVSRTNAVSEALRFKAISTSGNYTNSYALEAASSVSGANPVTNYLSNHSGVNNNMGFYSDLDAGAYLQFIPAVQVTVVDGSAAALAVTAEGNEAATGVFYKPVGVDLTTFTVNGYALGDNSQATIGDTTYTGATAILAAINALTADATVTIPTVNVTFTEASGDTTMLTITIPQGGTVAEPTFTAEQTQVLATFTLAGTVYDARRYHRSALCTALAGLTSDATVTVHLANGAFTTTDLEGNVLTDGGYYFLKSARSSSSSEYFISRSNNLFKPTTTYSVAEYAKNSTIFRVQGGSAGSDGKDYLRLAVTNAQDTYVGTDLDALESSSNYDNIAGNNATSNTTSKVFATTDYDNFVTFRADHQADSLYGLQVVGSNAGSTVETYMSNIYGASNPVGFYNVLNDAGTEVIFVPALKVTFTGPNGVPVKVRVNGEDHANGVIRVPYGHSLVSLTPPTRFATYTIGEKSGLSAQQVMDSVADFTTDMVVRCNAYFNLAFLAENGDSISSDIHAMGYVSGYANKHSIGMGCCITNIILSGYDKLDYTYVLDGEEYDLISFYEALMNLEVAQGQDIAVIVKEGTEEMTVLDINGNPLVSGNNYYIQFPARSDYKMQGSTSTSNSNLNLTSGMSYAAPASNRLVFQPVGNDNYMRIVPAFKDGYYVASTDVTDGYDKVKLLNNADYALKFRAEKNTTYTNSYALRVANHNGTVETFLSSAYGADKNIGFRSRLSDNGYELVQFVPYMSGLTLNFVDTNGDPVSVVIHNNTDNNNSTAQNSGTAVSTMTYDVTNASTLATLQDYRFYYQTAAGVGMNAINYAYNGDDYTSWSDLLSSGAANGDTVTVTLAATGIQPLDINGNPVVAGRQYRLVRLASNQQQYVTQVTKINTSTSLTTDGTQYWTATPAATNDWSTMTLALNGNTLSFSGNIDAVGTAYADGSTGTSVTLRAVLADRTTHYYFLETTLSETNVRFGNPSSTFGFYTSGGRTGPAVKFAFVPVGIVDYYNGALTADRPYRLEMPAKVAQTNFPAGRPVTLTLSSVDSNTSVQETSAIATSVEQYNTYYWLPDTYTGLDYMYNEKQVFYFEPVFGTDGGYYLSSANGYVTVASYNNGAAVTVNNAVASTIFYGVEAQCDGLEGICGIYTYDPSAASPTKLYLCAPKSTKMVLSNNPTQSTTRWNADCVFRIVPLKSQSLSDAYTNGNVAAKGWDCFGPGKTATGLQWNATLNSGRGGYETATGANVIETRNWLLGTGDKNDSIVGYHLPETIYLAYDYGTSAYKETVDFTAPTLIGYHGTITTTKNADGYYEFTNYELKKYPIIASPAPTIGPSGGYEFDMANTHWYMIDINEKKDQDLINNNLQATVQLSSLTNPFVDKYLFCFVGDSINGYLVYNKAQGAAHFMGPRNEQAHWYEANNIVWNDFATSTEEKRNKSRIIFQYVQHDGAGYYTFVDRYSGFGLDRWSDYIVYWHGRPIHNGGGYADNASGNHITTDYQKSQLGVIPNSFYRGSNILLGRTMGFPPASETYSRLIRDAISSPTGLSSMIGYVGMFRSQEDIDARYAWYCDTIAQLAANTALNETQYQAALVVAYNEFFNWLKEYHSDGGTNVLNGVPFERTRYYYLKSVSDEKYLVVTSGSEGDASYSLTTTTTPENYPGAVWQFEPASLPDNAYFGSELNTSHYMHNIYWNAYLSEMTNGTAATLVLASGTPTPIDVYNDMTVMENPGQYVLRTASNGYLQEADTCLAVIDGTVKGHQGRVGGGQRRWYIVPLMTETPTSTDAWDGSKSRVEEFTGVAIPSGYTWTNGTTIGNSVATDLVFTTYCNPERHVAFPHNSNIYAFRADYEVGSQAIHLEQLDDLSGLTIPAGMGVVMLAPNGTVIPFLPVASAGVTNTSSLLVSAGDELSGNLVEEGNYVFVYKKSGTDYALKFYKVGSKGATLGYHRAYLPSSVLEYAARSLSSIGFNMLFDDGTVTHITLPLTDSEDGDDIFGSEAGDGNAYDLQGRRVTDPTQPGVYIVNGRKVYVK